MPRSCNPSPSVSHFLAIDVVRIGQSVLLSIQAARSAFSCDWRR